MNTISVGVGEYAASRTPGDVIKTFDLGSCVGVVFLVPHLRMVGLLHLALPDSSINSRLYKDKPGMFVNSGILALLNEMQHLGYKQNDRTIVKLAGGATIMDPNNTFNIGKRNLLAIKKTLWKYRLGVLAEDTGSSISRTVSVEVDSGQIELSSPARGQWKL